MCGNVLEQGDAEWGGRVSGCPWGLTPWTKVAFAGGVPEFGSWGFLHFPLDGRGGNMI